MSNPFVQRVANWLAQEVVVKGLAENKAFQRFALRTDHKLKEFTEKVDVTKVTAAAENLAKEASKAAESVSATVQREMQATPKPREIGFKSKQDLLREAREKARKAQDLTHELSAERDSLAAKLAKINENLTQNEAQNASEREPFADTVFGEHFGTILTSS